MAAISRSLRFLSLFLVAFASIAFPAFAQEHEIDRFRKALIDYFLPLNYIPVLVNRGYSVGDVIDIDGVDFEARSA